MEVAPVVSVVIPVYERSLTLKDAIESVFMQDYAGVIETIVVDDGSSDFVFNSLKPYFSRIKYFKLAVNSGVSTARNVGIRKACGKYLAFLDSDDIFLPSKISIQMDSLLRRGLSVSHSDEFWYKRDRFINQSSKHKRYGGDIFCSILDFCRVSPSSLLVHKDVFETVGLFDESLRVCEDYEWSLRCALKYEFDYVQKKLLIKRAVTDNSLSASIKYIESLRLDILNDFVKKYGHILDARKFAALNAEIERKNSIVKR